MRTLAPLAALALVCAALVMPTASANYAECDYIFPHESDLGDPTQPVEEVSCAVVGIAIWVGFETVQCVVHGESDIC